MMAYTKYKKINYIYVFAAFLLALLTQSSAMAATAGSNDQINDQPPLATHQVFANSSHIVPGLPIRLAVVQNIKPGWHTYWKNPGDSGNPTIFNWDISAKLNGAAILSPIQAQSLRDYITISAPQFAVPKAIATPPLTTFGYEGQTSYLFDMNIADGLTKFVKQHGVQSIAITAKIDALVCHDICIPAYDEITLDLPLTSDVTGASEAHHAIFTAASRKLPQNKPGWTATYLSDGDDVNLTIDIKNIPANMAEDLALSGHVYFYPDEWGMINYQEKPVIIQIDADHIQLKFQHDPARPLSEVPTIHGVLQIGQENSEQTNYIQISAQSAIQPASATNNVQKTAPISFITAILSAILGGVILNLMPCVFPVLSMKALSLVQLNKDEQTKARAHGLSYTAGILVMFAIIAAVFLSLKTAGSQIGWGFQFQNPYIVLGLVYLLFLIGLNLAGFFDISGRFAGMGQGLTQSKGHKGSFMTGMLATLVATPCTAPFMGTAIGFTLTQPAGLSMLVFLALGLGLALPYLLLCYIPALRGFMPRPGVWMDVFKQFLAFPMFASALWLLWVLSLQTGADGVLIAIAGMIALVFAIWLAKHIPDIKAKPITSWLIRLLAILVVIIALMISAKLPAPSSHDITANRAPVTSSQSSTSGHFEYSPAQLDQLLSGPDPVFVNMTAAWCITCKVNEKVALSTQSVKDAFAAHNIAYIKGDWTNYNADITEFLEKYGRSGVPIYVYYGAPDAATGQRPPPYVLPQILTPALVIDVVTSK